MLPWIGLTRTGSGVISTQALHEYAAGAIRKLSLADDIVQDRVDLLSRFEIVTPSVEALKAALALRSMHRLSFWDALILQAARDGGCTALLSEDLATGATLAGVSIVDPFAAPSADAAGAAPPPARAPAKRRRAAK